eukprot:306896-Karenia_brevis.AAC.1
MTTVLSFTGALRTGISLRSYGATSLKPLQIWHVHPAYEAIRSKDGQVRLPKEEQTTLCTTYSDKRGVK